LQKYLSLNCHSAESKCFFSGISEETVITVKQAVLVASARKFAALTYYANALKRVSGT